MRALSIRQPWAELILRGIKTIEYRSRPTRIVGERFWIYAAKGPGTEAPRHEGTKGNRIWSADLATGDVSPWMIELANALRMFPEKLPTGVIVGSAVISGCERIDDRGLRIEGTPSSIVHPPSSRFAWHLTDVQRVTRVRKPRNHPQPVWFVPF